MSATDDPPEDMVDTSKAGGLDEIVPDPLMPVWRRIERVQSFRQTHGGTYIAVLEAITAILLTGGYVWWLYIFLFGGSG